MAKVTTEARALGRRDPEVDWRSPAIFMINYRIDNISEMPAAEPRDEHNKTK